MLAALFALSFSAAAATHEVSFEAGWIGAWDPAFDYFADGNALGSYGLRVGYAVHPNVAVIAGWQHAVHGAGIVVPGLGSETGDDDYYGQDAFFAALYSDQVSVGAKADVQLLRWLHPYVTAQLVGMRGLVRLDDDLNDDENVTQREVAGLTGGLLGGAGLDIPIRVKGRWAIAPYVELGYGWMAPMQLEGLGSLQFAGFSGRTGIGVRF